MLESKEGDKPIRTAWTPAARIVGSLAAQAPRLVLDVVPTDKAVEAYDRASFGTTLTFTTTTGLPSPPLPPPAAPNTLDDKK